MSRIKKILNKFNEAKFSTKVIGDVTMESTGITVPVKLADEGKTLVIGDMKYQSLEGKGSDSDVKKVAEMFKGLADNLDEKFESELNKLGWGIIEEEEQEEK